MRCMRFVPSHQPAQTHQPNCWRAALTAAWAGLDPLDQPFEPLLDHLERT